MSEPSEALNTASTKTTIRRSPIGFAPVFVPVFVQLYVSHFLGNHAGISVLRCEP